MKTIAYVGQENDFFRFLQLASGGNILQYPTMEAAGADALTKQYDAVVAVAAEHTLLQPLSYAGMQCYAELQ